MSSGDVWEAATTEPAVGMCVLPALPRELGRVSGVEERELGSVNDLPSSYAVDLQINPPDARDSDDAPEVCFAEESARGGPLDESEPDEPGKDQERYTKEEEELRSVSARSGHVP
jgi:hypothetical protein